MVWVAMISSALCRSEAIVGRETFSSVLVSLVFEEAGVHSGELKSTEDLDLDFAAVSVGIRASVVDGVRETFASGVMPAIVEFISFEWLGLLVECDLVKQAFVEVFERVSSADRYLVTRSSGAMPAAKAIDLASFSDRSSSGAKQCRGWSGRSKGRLSSDPGRAQDLRRACAKIKNH